MLTLDRDDLELLEGDVVHGYSDGIVSIDFSNRVWNLTAKNFDQTIIVKLLGRKIGYSTLCNKINEVLKPSKTFHLLDIENDYFLITFRARSDYMKALTKGLWMIFGHYQIIEP
ncbi:hypothetical protein V6N12_044407 [Hibiscus sabdariffa]|uniref:DUF4283 domain-containing protein n=1 Tax=Hibiscus sabdariffa TaxID=183260 RepID=A0ABR2ANS6_9ROSI